MDLGFSHVLKGEKMKTEEVQEVIGVTFPYNPGNCQLFGIATMIQARSVSLLRQLDLLHSFRGP